VLGDTPVVERYGEEQSVGAEELIGRLGGQRPGLQLLGRTLLFRHESRVHWVAHAVAGIGSTPISRVMTGRN
jgi:hypothetical protein